MIAIYVNLYKLAIHFYRFGIWIASFFSAKAQKWIEGRSNIFKQLENDFQNHSNPIWIHCASLGEFEQGRPIIELIKAKNPEEKILVTFFSPSGYEIRKDYKSADWVYYLPLDTKKNAQRFLKIVQPKFAIFVKYEFWYYFLFQLKKHQIPTFLISALFRKDQAFFKWYGSLFRKMLVCFSKIYVQDKSSKKLLESINIENVSVAGDTRIDRVHSISKRTEQNLILTKFAENHKILIAGSTWPADEKILLKFVNNPHLQEWKYIIAPHEISKQHMQTLENQSPIPFLKYSEIKENEDNIKDFQVLIIDNIGMLASLYQYGNLAYIGGGFGAGIHNILEPATFGLPIIFGPKYQKFQEAKSLVQLQGAFTIKDEKEFSAVFEKLLNASFYDQAAQQSRSFIEENIGASKLIFEAIEKVIK